MKLLKLIGLCLFVSLSLNAGVNLKNGNFYIANNIISVPGTGPNLEIIVTYNSRTTHDGWFGFGWGSKFETFLTKAIDGCIMVYEHGGGSENRFCPKTKVKTDDAVKKVLAAAQKENPNLSGAGLKSFTEKLKTNASFLNRMAQKYNLKGSIPVGTVLTSSLLGPQKLEITKSGYMRYLSDGETEKFNEDGQLTEIKTKDNYKLSLEYRKKSLYSLKDSFGKVIYFSWYPNGKVKQVWSNGEKKTQFKYDKEHNMVSFVDIDQREFAYQYDENHNLVFIDYAPNVKSQKDKDFMKMTYDPKTLFVTSVRERNGILNEYKYGADPKKPDMHYWTEVTKKFNSDVRSKNKYEYEEKTRPNGSRYTYRTKTEIAGVETETIYTECCGLPLKITRGKNVTNFKYDGSLLVEKRRSNGEFVKVNYDKKVNKISRVETNDKWTSYGYDPKGNLTDAQTSKGEKLKLVYDSKGKIQTFLVKSDNSKDVKKLSFKYGTIGKPTEIAMGTKGKIKIQYGSMGEILSVKPEGDEAIANDIAAEFRNLMSIVKTSEVNLDA